MSEFDFTSVFTADFATGRVYWKSPPKNHAEKMGREAGAIAPGNGRTKPYWHLRAFGRTFKRSRVIFYLVHGRWPTPAVDHINGDSLDDRPVNLRECTLTENAANCRPRERDLPRGVYRTVQGKFMARITKGGRTANLGVYDTAQSALAVYDRARMEVFGDFS